MISSGTEAVDRKQRIRDRYKGVDTSELEVIPAKAVEGLGESTSIRRVAAYVRVSTDNDISDVCAAEWYLCSRKLHGRAGTGNKAPCLLYTSPSPRD